MNLLKRNFLISGILSLAAFSNISAEKIDIKINKKYINIPISHQQDRKAISFKMKGEPDLSVVARLTAGEPEYWVFKDVSNFKGKTITIECEGDDTGLSKVYQSDKFHEGDMLYKERNRPQFHYSAQRGWINDPNGLVYHDGEYHLYYQHNPYERDWENIHWGHAVSKDLVHWEELPDVLPPDHLGRTFSGSAVVDYDNTAGYNKKGKPAMLAFYTADDKVKEVQCMAYSLDNGRTFTKYDKNPILDTYDVWKTIDLRDPKVFWYEPSGHWVMLLNERDGHSIYTSNDLKDWNYESHVTGFWECPELFELPIDGDANNTKWVMYGATGTYMLGDFDGKTFTPETGKYNYLAGQIYAAQTFTNVPESDGRRIQVGWGQITNAGMPFNGIVTMPTELTLHNTKEGVRLMNKPVKELDQLFTLADHWKSLTQDQATEKLKAYSDVDCLRLKITFKLSHATDAGLRLNGQRIVGYDMNRTIMNDVFYSPQDMTSMEVTTDVYMDRTSFEVFVDGGLMTYVMGRDTETNNKDGFRFYGNNVEITNLEVYNVKSIWNK